LVYSPLATGTGTNTATISVWCHFKDVELVGPAVTQMDGSRRPVGKKVNPSEGELGNIESRPLSTALARLSSVASDYTKVPKLSAMAGPTSWVLNALSGAASAFGYSKPTTETAVIKVTELGNFNAPNHNGVDVFPNMALDATNKLSVMEGYSGTDEDEMVLSSLCQRFAYIDTMTWATSNAVGDVLGRYDNHPHVGNYGTVVNFWNTRDVTPLSYFSSFFHYWRGSLRYKLKFVKTPYHSGRIQIVYNPASIDPTTTTSAYLLREIIDIRENDEYEF